MTELLENFVLISVPFFIFALIMRGRVLFTTLPSSRLVQAILIAIVVGNVLAATASQLLGMRPLLFGASITQWGGFLLFCFFWARGIYLLCTPVQNQTSTGA